MSNGYSNQSFVTDDEKFADDNASPHLKEPNKKIYPITNGIQTLDTTNDDEEPLRDNWGKSIEFLMSCIAMSVGLGNVWRFPFTALENGGGAFLIPYIITLILVGRPLYYLEMVLGQFSSRGSIKLYDLSPAMRGIACGQLIAIICLATYYSSIIALTFSFLIDSFYSELPWAQCKAEWSEKCLDATGKIYQNGTLCDVNTCSTTNNDTMTSSELYFLKDVLKEKDSIHDGIGLPDWRLSLCLLFSWTCVLLLLIKGIRSSGKASYFLALFPYVIMFILLIRAVTLPGAVDGIIYFIKPQWNELLNPKVWYAAVTQCFFSLSVCFGNIIMYSSFNKFDHNIVRDANIVTSIDTLTSLLAGFTIFGILGHLAHELGSDDVGSVVRGGSGLAFISYPDAIARFDWVPQVFSVLFFFMLFVLGLGSNVAIASNIITIIRDAMPKVKSWQAAIVVSAAGMLIGLVYVTPGGQYILLIVDYYGGSFIIYILAVAELITISWIYGVDRMCQDIEFMLSRKTGWYWRICWGLVTPVFMIVILIYSLTEVKPVTYNDYVYPNGAYALGWCIVALGVIQIPIWICVAVVKYDGITFWDKLVGAFYPIKSWGPINPHTLEKYRKYLDEVLPNEAELNSMHIMRRIRLKMFGK